MTLEKDLRAGRLSVCPVGTGAHRDAGTGSPRAGAVRSAWGEVSVSLGTLPTYCEVLLCPLSPSPLRHKLHRGGITQSWQADLMSVCLLGCTSQILLFCVEGFWHPCLKQVYWCHFFPGRLLTVCLCAASLCNCCSISNASSSKKIITHWRGPGDG